MLYDRDYKILTKQEQNQFDKVENWFNKLLLKSNGRVSGKQLTKYWQDMPLAGRFHKSLFPNHNYVNEQHNIESTQKIIKGFKELLDGKATERDIQNFIKINDAYFLIASSVLLEFSTGNHDSYIFREFNLPPNHWVDYLLIGKNSGGYDFIFVELENINEDITTKTGEFGTTIRKGIKQIEDWDTSIDSNFSHLKLIFDKHKNSKKDLPSEFLNLDKSRIHYAVIAGRRSNYSEKTYRLRRKFKKNNGIAILHYDNIVDLASAKLNEVLKKSGV
jgi:Domain of unknown function (DUF4263)